MPALGPVLTLLDLDPSFCAWAADRDDLEAVWRECDRPDWLVALATRAGVERPVVVRAAGECVALAQSELGQAEHEAVALARRWAEGDAHGAACWAAGCRASQNARTAKDPRRAAASRAAAAIGFACDADADDSYYASRCHAAEATGLASSCAPNLRLAAVVRERIPFDRVRDALEVRVNHLRAQRDEARTQREPITYTRIRY